MSAVVHRYNSSAKENISCLYEEHKCSRPRVSGQRYCLEHVRPGSDGMFFRCQYVGTRSGLQCTSACPKDGSKKNILCAKHTKAVASVRRKIAQRNNANSWNMLSIVNSLEVDPSGQSTSVSANPDASVSSVASNQPTDGQATSDRTPQKADKKAANTSSDTYCDSSEDDDDPTESVTVCRGFIGDSDVETDEAEDPLKHAGAYTPEEITLITRDKLIQLQALYIEFLSYLKRRYVKKRIEYKRRIQMEKETLGPVTSGAGNPRQKRKLEQLSAYRRYNRRFGEEALLHQQSQKRRHIAMNRSEPPEIEEPAARCAAFTNGMACSEPTLPQSPMCGKHVLCDGKQLLFVKCETENCRNAIIRVGGLKQCWLHQPVLDIDSNSFQIPVSFPQTIRASEDANARQLPDKFVQASPSTLPQQPQSQQSQPHPQQQQSQQQIPAQKSSVFSPFAPTLPVFTPTSEASALRQPFSASAMRGKTVLGKKFADNGVGRGRGAFLGAGLTVPAKGRIPTATGTKSLISPGSRSVPSIEPRPVGQSSSFEDISSETGVYGAYVSGADNFPDDNSEAKRHVSTTMSGNCG